jgi:uncharacterized membrane protein (UPF0127 family)
VYPLLFRLGFWAWSTNGRAGMMTRSDDADEGMIFTLDKALRRAVGDGSAHMTFTRAFFELIFAKAAASSHNLWTFTLPSRALLFGCSR